MIISFAWTTPALLAGAKTMTRRVWSPDHAAKFRAGQLVDAWNQTPRVNSKRLGIATARKVATIRITGDPYVQMVRPEYLTPTDHEREGFDWLRQHGYGERVDEVIASWDPCLLTVVEFELVSIERSVDAPAAPDVRPAEGVDPDSDPSASPREVATTRGALGRTSSGGAA